MRVQRVEDNAKPLAKHQFGSLFAFVAVLPVTPKNPTDVNTNTPGYLNPTQVPQQTTLPPVGDGDRIRVGDGDRIRVLKSKLGPLSFRLPGAQQSQSGDLSYRPPVSARPVLPSPVSTGPVRPPVAARPVLQSGLVRPPVSAGPLWPSAVPAKPLPPKLQPVAQQSHFGAIPPVWQPVAQQSHFGAIPPVQQPVAQQSHFGAIPPVQQPVAMVRPSSSPSPVAPSPTTPRSLPSGRKSPPTVEGVKTRNGAWNDLVTQFVTESKKNVPNFSKFVGIFTKSITDLIDDPKNCGHQVVKGLLKRLNKWHAMNESELRVFVENLTKKRSEQFFNKFGEKFPEHVVKAIYKMLCGDMSSVREASGVLGDCVGDMSELQSELQARNTLIMRIGSISRGRRNMAELLTDYKDEENIEKKKNNVVREFYIKPLNKLWETKKSEYNNFVDKYANATDPEYMVFRDVLVEDYKLQPLVVEGAFEILCCSNEDDLWNLLSKLEEKSGFCAEATDNSSFASGSQESIKREKQLQDDIRRSLLVLNNFRRF